MIRVIDHIKRLDFVLLFSVILISGIGLLSIYSSSPSLLLRQAVFVVGGIFLMVAISFIDWRSLKENSYIIIFLYLLSLFSLYGLLLFAPTIRNVRRWYEVGPILFDPGEITKIILIVLLAKYFSTRHAEMYNVLHIVLSGLYVLVPAFLIFKQPDLGSSLILIIMWIGVLFLSGIKLKHFMVLALIGATLFLSGWFFFLEDYQKDRAIAFINPELDPQGIGWGQTQAKIAVGSGGLFGKGIGSGTQTQYGFLPEPQTDFIFSAIAEEFGLVGVAILFFGFIVFLWRLVVIVFRSKTNFPRLFVFGFALLVLAQVFINIGMNLGLLPIIGTPLPLVSYGGSNLFFIFFCLGIIQNIQKDKRC